MSSAEFYKEAAIEALRAAELRRILKKFDERNLHPLFFKGTALAYGIYGQPWQRARFDHDLLFTEDEFATAEHLLLDSGYRVHEQLEIFNEKCLYREDDFSVSHVWDLHKRVSNRAIAANLFTHKELWARGEPLAALGATARRVEDIDQILLTAMHAVCHHRARWDADWLEDGRLLLARLNESQRAELRSRAEEKNLSGITKLFLKEIFRATSDPTPNWILDLPDGEGERLTHWALHPPSVAGQLWSDFTHQAGVIAKLRFLLALLAPPQRYRQYHRRTHWSRWRRIFFA